MSWRARARDLSLIFCAALGVYLISIILAARLGMWLVGWLGQRELAGWARLLLGTAVLDLSKAPALLLLGWALRRALSLSPGAAALLLLGFVYLFELLTGLALGQGTGLGAAQLLARLAAAGLLWVALRQVLKRAARPAGPAQTPP